MLDAVELHDQAAHGALLLTPSVRSARQVRFRITQVAVDPGKAGELADRVLPWRAWTTRLWQQTLLAGRDERVLLQPLQERMLWERVLDGDPATDRTDALLGLCQSAAALLYQYDAAATLSTWTSQEDSDVARFAGWFRTFRQRCEREQLLPMAALESALAEGPAIPVDTIVCCGLADLPPARQKLLDALAKRGTAVFAASAHETTGVPMLLQCRDDRAELDALAQHLSRALASSTRPSLAVVVPDLSSARDRIDRTLREHLNDAAADISADSRRSLWEFSTGRPLASMGIIADALHLLTWTVRDLETEEISLVLRSRHFDWPIDAERAASLDAAILRRTPHLSGTWSARSAARLLEKSIPALAAALLDRTREWASLRHTASTFNSFAERARNVLRHFGWLRNGERSSSEYQAVKRLENLLDDLAALDLLGGTQPTWPEFIQRLSAAVRATSFAPENTGAPIQILTPDESTGLEADELWMLHADENRWSSHAAMQPLLPPGLQRRFGMPGADPALDQRRHRDRTERIARIAPTTTFSFAEAGESGAQRPSTAVAALPSLQHEIASVSGAVDQIEASAALETFDDGGLIPLPTGDDLSAIPGGVSTLQSQAACAFRAFAERRLSSATLDSHDLGMDARDRGSLLHTALQLFWEATRTSDALHRLIAEDRLVSQIHRAVDLALRERRDPVDRWSEAYLEIQRTRLEKLMMRWLRKEAERPPFEVVELEREVLVKIAGLPLKVRVDRVDRVTLPDAGTAHVIVDYKTGDPNPSKWEGDRPDEPQLLLYATSAMPELADTTQAPVGAIAFGVVRAGDKLNFVSAPRKSAWLVQDAKAHASTLNDAIDGWRQTLENLAHEFRSGIARVGPKEYPATCRFCEQRLLCRLNPSLLEAEESVEVDA